MRVLVTGAAGFVGSAVVRKLLADGEHTVIAAVRPNADCRTCFGKFLTSRHLGIMGWKPGTIFPPVDAVLHAAWWGVRGAARNDPGQLDNVKTTIDVLQAAAAAGTKRFVGIGSQAERFSERFSYDSRSTIYGLAKSAASELVLAAAPKFNISAAWPRLFSIYGPSERSNALVPSLIHALRAGKSLPLNSCRQSWDYLYEDDCAEALALLLERDDVTGCLDLASGEARPLRVAVEEIYRLAGRRLRPMYGRFEVSACASTEMVIDEAGRKMPAWQATHRKLNWAPKVSLVEGLARCVKEMP